MSKLTKFLKRTTAYVASALLVSPFGVFVGKNEVPRLTVGTPAQAAISDLELSSATFEALEAEIKSTIADLEAQGLDAAAIARTIGEQVRKNAAGGNFTDKELLAIRANVKLTIAGLLGDAAAAAVEDGFDSSANDNESDLDANRDLGQDDPY